jgi:hypothetical protein
MRTKVLTLSFALAALFTLQSTAFVAESEIGNASVVKNKVDGMMEGQSRRLSNGSEVHSNEVVYTGAASMADLIFKDKTVLKLGPVSEIRLDKFVYDPSGSTATVVIQATRGAFRFVTGGLNKDIQIKTKFGTLGVRG